MRADGRDTIKCVGRNGNGPISQSLHCRKILIAVSALASLWPSTAVAEEEILWPSEVRRVDPSSQTFERLPPKAQTAAPRTRPAGAFRVRGFVRTKNSASFIFNKKHYRLSNADPIANSKVCIDAQGKRWACGIKARNSLQKLLTTSGVYCVPVAQDETWIDVTCGNDDFDLAEEMVKRGFAVAH